MAVEQSCVLSLPSKYKYVVSAFYSAICLGMPGTSGIGAHLTGTRALCADTLSCTGPSDAWHEEFKRDMAQLDTNLRALINNPSVLSTTTLQQLGGLANKKPNLKVDVSLQQAHALTWDSPIGAQVTYSSVQLLEADKGQQNGLQSLFAELLPTAPINSPFVSHDAHEALCLQQCPEARCCDGTS